MLHGSFDSHSIPGEGASITALFPIIENAEAKADDCLKIRVKLRRLQALNLQ